MSIVVISLAWHNGWLRNYMSKVLANLSIQGPAFGLGAAILFGLSSPLAKILLQDNHPVLIAGLLYAGAGLGLLIFEVLSGRYTRSNEAKREAPLRSEDWGLLVGILVSGGILGPVLMLYGLQRLSAIPASLLLNLEMPFTILLAVTFFREHLGNREVAAVLFNNRITMQRSPTPSKNTPIPS